jgi:hypothetical protein
MVSAIPVYYQSHPGGSLLLRRVLVPVTDMTDGPRDKAEQGANGGECTDQEQTGHAKRFGRTVARNVFNRN